MSNFMYDQMKQVLIKMYAEGLLDLQEYLDLYCRVLEAEEKQNNHKEWRV